MAKDPLGELPEIDNLISELENETKEINFQKAPVQEINKPMPLPQMPAEMPPSAPARKGGLFSKIFGKKQKEETAADTPNLNIPSLPKEEDFMPPPTPEQFEIPQIESFKQDAPKSVEQAEKTAKSKDKKEKAQKKQPASDKKEGKKTLIPQASPDEKPKIEIPDIDSFPNISGANSIDVRIPTQELPPPPAIDPLPSGTEETKKKSFFGGLFSKKEDKKETPKEQNIPSDIPTPEELLSQQSSSEEVVIPTPEELFNQIPSTTENDMKTLANEAKMNEASALQKKPAETAKKASPPKNAKKEAKKEVANAKKIKSELSLARESIETPKKARKKIKIPKPKKGKDYTHPEVKKMVEVMQKDLEIEQRKIREKENSRIKTLILAKEREVSDMLGRLSQRLEHLEEYEKGIEKKEADLLDKEKSHSKNTDLLLQLKKKHDSEVKSRLSYLHKIESEFKNKSSEIEKKLRSISKMEMELEYRQRETATKESNLGKWETGLNTRELSLDKREKEIETQLNFLTRKSKELAERDKVISVREKEYEERSSILSRKRKELEEEKVAFLKVKDEELRHHSQKLKEREQDVEKSIREKTAMLKQKEEELSKLAQKLEAKEKELNMADNALDMAMEKYSKEKNDLEDEEFHEYLHRKLSEISSHKDVMKKSVSTLNLDAPKYQETTQKISSMIAQCRSEIKQGNFDAAKKSYNQIRLEYYKTKLSDEEKEEFHNTIRSLYDEINLAMLNK